MLSFQLQCVRLRSSFETTEGEYSVEAPINVLEYSADEVAMLYFIS